MHISGTQVYSNGNSGEVEYGYYFDGINQLILCNSSLSCYDNFGGGFKNTVYVRSSGKYGGLIFLNGETDVNTKLLNLYANNGSLKTNSNFEVNGVTKINKIANDIKTITSNISIRRDGDNEYYIILVDASNGNITISIDYPSYLPNRSFIIKKIDNTSNIVRISPVNKNIDGATSLNIDTQYSYYHIISNGTNWYTI